MTLVSLESCRVPEKLAYCGLSWSVLLVTYYSGDQIKKSDMGGACSMYGGGRKMGARFCYGKMKGLPERFRHRLESVNWIDIAQDRER